MKRARIGVVSLVVGVLLAVPGGSAAQGPRMVGKGSLPETTPAGARGTASYAYIVPCNPPPGFTPAFEVRITGGPLNGQRFRVTGLDTPLCRHDPLAPSPPAPAGFNFAGGLGDVTASLGGGVNRIGYSFLDGGPGGANDSASIVLVRFPATDPANFFEFGGAPPGKFPGSSQPTGFNTAQP